MADWRTIQLFLSPKQPAIYEVQINLDEPLTRCNCPTFKGRRACRHTKLVSARMEGNDGSYPMLVSERAEEADISKVMSDPDAFREFVVKYGKIEVL